MGVCKRAWLYLARKKLRSGILFVLLFAAGLFLLVGGSVRMGADLACEDIKKSLTSSIDITVKPVDRNEFYDITENENGQEVSTAKKEIFTWECSISPEKEKYYSTFTGTEQDRAEEMLKTSYVAVSPGDTGEFDVKIYPDTPGLYEIKATVEYTYKDRVEKKESKSKKFIFDPELELQMENVIGVQDEKKITAYGRLYRYGRTGRMYSQI